MQLKNNTICYTQNNNAIIVYNINNFEVVTSNYVDDEILVTIYDKKCNCIAITTFYVRGDGYDYSVFVNNTTENKLHNVMQKLYLKLSK